MTIGRHLPKMLYFIWDTVKASWRLMIGCRCRWCRRAGSLTMQDTVKRCAHQWPSTAAQNISTYRTLVLSSATERCVLINVLVSRLYLMSYKVTERVSSAVIMAEPLQEFTRFIMAPSGRRPKTKPDDLGCESACTRCQKLHPPSPIISQPSIYIDGWLYGMRMTSVTFRCCLKTIPHIIILSSRHESDIPLLPGRQVSSS